MGEQCVFEVDNVVTYNGTCIGFYGSNVLGCKTEDSMSLDNNCTQVATPCSFETTITSVITGTCVILGSVKGCISLDSQLTSFINNCTVL